MKQFSNQDNFYKRLRELADVEARTKSQSLDSKTLVEYARANDGTALGIIKENDSFYIKSSNVKGDNLHAADFTYIGGLENKLKFKYGSLSEAIKNRNFKLGNLNESLERKFSVAKNLNEEQELLAKTFADKGGIANAQDAADKNKGSEVLKTTASEKEVAEVGKDDGIAKAQSIADSNKSDDATAKLNKKHEPSTVNGKARTDIAKAQTNAESNKSGEALKITASEKEVAEVGKDGGIAKAQSEADKLKKNVSIKKEGHKEVHPASDAKKETAIVVENFGKSDDEVEINAADAENVAPNAQPSDSEMSPDVANNGGAESDINAAAAALDSLDTAPEASSGMNTPEMSATAPTTGDEVATDAADLSDLGLDSQDSVEGESGDDAAVLKDIEKLVGKVGQKIRSANIPQEMVIGFLKSIISASEDKLADADLDDKRELAHDIEKAGETNKDGSPESSVPTIDSNKEDSVETPAPDFGDKKPAEEKPEGGEEPDDKDIEEAINSHLQDLAKNTGADKTQVDSKVKPFKNYMDERGYTSESLNDCSIMEMASLVSGYANEIEGVYENADMQAIAEFMSPEVKEAVTEAGHHEFVKKAEPFIGKTKTKKFESIQPNLMKEEMEEAKKLEEYGNEHPISVEDALNGKSVAESTVEEDKKKVEEDKKKVNFAPIGQSMNKVESKKVEEDKKEEESKEQVSESVKKLRLIVKSKIEEQLGLKKKSLNESAKSKLSKKIDLMISEEIKKNKDFLKKYNVK